jgi:hypothetical protein
MDYAEITISSCGRWELQRYPRTLAWSTFNSSIAAVQNCDALHDGKPETRAAAVPRAGGIHTVKPVEDAREMLRRNATAVVRHGNQKSSIVARGF